MTMVIATVLPDGAVLAADGLSIPLVQGAPIDIDARKIRAMGGAFAVATLGVEYATEFALDYLEGNLAKVENPRSFLRELTRATETGWNRFARKFASHPDLLHPKVSSSLMGVGIAGGMPCAICVVHTREGAKTPLFAVTPFERLIVGSPPWYRPGGEFDAVLNESLQRVSGDTPGDDFARGVIKASIAEIRAASRVEPTLGGVIRYAWVRDRNHIEEGVDPDEKGTDGKSGPLQIEKSQEQNAKERK